MSLVADKLFLAAFLVKQTLNFFDINNVYLEPASSIKNGEIWFNSA